MSRPSSNTLPPKPPTHPQSPPTPSTTSHPSPLDVNNSSPQHDLSHPPSPLLTAAAFPSRPFLKAAANASDADRAYLRTAEAELLDEIQAVRHQLRLARQRVYGRRNRRLRRTSSVGDDFAHAASQHAVSKQPSSSTDKPMRRRIISVSLRLPTARERTSVPRQLFDNALPPNAIFSLRDATNLPIVWVGAVNPSPSNSSPSSMSLPNTPTLNDRSVAFDDPTVEQTYRKRRSSRYSANRDRRHQALESRSVAVPLPVEPEVMDRFYFFCEHILWRLLHYDYGSVGKGSELDDYFAAYRFVNQRFVETISEIYEDGDLIWVHNYHLMLLPSLLRESIWYAKIGFFLYTPFPSAELFRILPYRVQILQGVIGADLIGFYSYDYSKQFVSACSRLLGIDGTPSYVEADPSTGRRCELAIYPAGIDVSSLRNFVSSKPVKSRIAELRARFEGLHVLVGVDRLDDSFCGIPLKLLAFELLLQNNPKLRGKVTFIQVATIPRQAHSTTTFRQQQMQVNECVGRINSLFGTFSFTPVHYINGELDPMELYALMSIGHACIVSPIRDGMALIPHEWTVCQHGAYKGAIVISEFAGAAQSFSTALHVNPWNVDQMAGKIKKALTMDDKERAVRNEAAYSFVTTHTAKLWGLNFLEDLEQCERVTASGSGVPTPVLDFSTVIHAYLGMAGTTSQVPAGTVRSSLQSSGIAGNSSSELSSVLLSTFGPAVRLPGFSSDQKLENALRNNLSTPTGKSDSARISPDTSSSKLNSRAALFILDLDGTLVPFQAITELGAPPQNIIDLIQRIKESSPLNYVLVTSSRDPSTVLKWLGTLNVYLAAEDGAFFRAPGDTAWTSLFRDNSGHDFHLNRSANSQSAGSDHVSLNSTSADSEQKRQTQPLKDDDQKRKKSSPSGSTPEVFGETNGTKKERKDVPLQEGHHRYTSASFASVSSSESMQNGEFTTSRPWKSLVMPAMKHFAERTPGVVLNDGDVTVTWHYIDSDTDFGRWQARDLFEHLESFLLQRLNVDLLTDSHRRWIKVRPKGVDKTTAVTRTIEHIKRNEKASAFDDDQTREPLYIDFVLCLGDDKADEGVFDMLKDTTRLEAIGIRAPNRVFTCRVGSPVTSAAYFLDSPARVVELLEEITSSTVSIPSQ